MKKKEFNNEKKYSGTITWFLTTFLSLLDRNPAPSPSLSTSDDAGAVSDEVIESKAESRFMDVEYSTAFSVEYLADDVKLVTDAEDQQFLLVPRGQDIPDGYDNVQTIYTL